MAWRNTFISVLIVFRLAFLADTQTSSFSVSCVPGSQETAFPNCNSWNNTSNVCADTITDQEWEACLCNQGYLDSLFGCESEMRLCFEDNREDDNFQSALSLWHSLCNAYITFSPTTPPISTIATSYFALCGNAVEEDCATASLLVHQCESYTDDAQFTSCYCQPNFLTLDYNCEFLGNTSCLGVPATLSNMIGYGCPNFDAVIGTGIASQSVITVSAAPTTHSDSPITPAPTRSPTIATQTATTKSSCGIRADGYSWLTYLLYISCLCGFL